MSGNRQQIPVIRLAGMSCACVFTLIGIFAGLAPEIILFRVGIGTAIVMLVLYAAIKAILAMGT
jgi:hypothetical protein